MMNSPNNDYAKYVLSLAGQPVGGGSRVRYDRDGDCIEFFTCGDDFRAERVDDLVTVYYSRDTQQIVGSLIKGASKFCSALGEKMPGLAIEIKDGPVKLEHLFLAGKWAKEHNKITSLTYEKLARIAEESDATAELCGT